MPSRAIPAPVPAMSPPVFYSLTPSPMSTLSSPVVQHRPTSGVSPRLVAAGAGAGISIFLTISVCFCKMGRKRLREENLSNPSRARPLREFSYSVLRRATASFSQENRLGQGGFGSVFRCSIAPSSSSAIREVAVKVMDSGSLQGEREFLNELFFAEKLNSPSVVSIIGFSHERKRRRMLLVYELMENGNLQDALLHRRCLELMEWNRRFLIAVDIAKGMEYLHSLDPPVIHGDIKPSNILLDGFFSAKISDFGLARLKSGQVEVTMVSESDGLKIDDNEGGGEAEEECGSVVEIESVITNTTGYEEFKCGCVEQSPESVSKVPTSINASPETTEAPQASPETTTTTISVSLEMVETANILDGVESDKDLGNVSKRNGKEMTNAMSKDWRWKQEGFVDGGKVNDYVVEWIGSEVKKEIPSSEWIRETAASSSSKKLEKNKSNKRLEWWISLDEEKEKKEMKKRKMLREWWKEEYVKELVKKKKKKKKKKKITLESEFHSDDLSSSVDQGWHCNKDLYSEKKKNKKKRRAGSSNSTSSSIDWWLDGLSGELWRARRNSHDSVSGEMTKSCGISSTPSMRGTVCYVAPEYGNLDDVSEKCDVYSYGVLLLVLVSGRRPLEVTGTASEIQRANLMSWARKLARRGRLLELIDKKIHSLDQEQALLCIKVALQCLQKSPVNRPSMKDVVGMLSGELSPPELPSEFSPTPHSQFSFKTRIHSSQL